MDEINWEEIEREAQERDARMKKREEDGLQNLLKHFDRIHDNLFNYNNLLIGGFFALAQFQDNIPRWTIVIPLMNLWFLILIEYRMMEKSRFEASITQQPIHLIDKYGESINKTNLFSLLSIITTLFVTICFLYLILFHN
ncbi:hypothetical protein E0W68_12065 [Flavobacterium salilacus subsp. salilacus]|uniref:hypothetical protein n=1 Tax=Flavobacterium TaxID=237 RepID=UPI001075881C|nr:MULTISPECIES: hypothetical protein [Flavobacterium]KAF2516262.1 hypothetical protein E0W68_12065 [Flavobacterium salilacus subsp. salilacus]MBE1613790.1 hypothetical protein [Flavobacterium sp. SaA2.13]